MKSLFDLSWNVSEEEYRKNEAYSYSTIAKYHREGFDKINNLFEPTVSTPSLVFGSIVDTIITGDKKEFEEKFVIAEFPEITDSLITISKTLFNKYGEVYTSISNFPDNILAEVGEECGYYAGAKFTNHRVKQIKENCGTYYHLLYLSNNKTIISTKDYTDAIQAVEVLRNHPSTKNYFSPNNPFNKIEKYYQLKFKGVYQNIPLRIMADLLIVDHVNKIITPIDLKTSFKKEWEFYKSFIDWCYWIQAQLYWYVIRQNLDQDDYYKDFILKDYEFIVVSRNNFKPLVWEYKDTKAEVDLFYGKGDIIKCRNWRNLVIELNWYIKNSSEYPMDIKYKEGELNDIITFLSK